MNCLGNKTHSVTEKIVLSFFRTTIVFWITLLALTGCSPRIEVTAPTAPITINLNVKIDHEIHINVDKEVESLISSSPELFQ